MVKYHKQTLDILVLLKRHNRLMKKARNLKRQGQRLNKEDASWLYQNMRNMSSMASELNQAGVKDSMDWYILHIASMEASDYINSFWFDSGQKELFGD